jgi:peptidoglycan/LPS O-acetylase OafA/YrhL
MSWFFMDTFFALSGLLIAGILLDSLHRPDYYRIYYTRRTLRIFPVYYCVIATLILGMALWNGGAAYQEFTQRMASPLWFFVYLGNFPIAFTGQWAPADSFSPLWSLQLEEQFYLLFPLAVRRLKLKTLSRILWWVVFLSPALRALLFWWNPHNAHMQYVLLPCHAEGLALGALIAIRFRTGPWDLDKRRLTVATFSLLAVSIATAACSGYTWNRPFNRTLGYSLSSMASASLLLWLICFRQSPRTRWFRSGLIQYVGKISYGAYLMHVPSRAVLDFLLRRLGWSVAPDNLLMVPVYAAVAIGCASLSWHLLERPLLRLKDLWAPTNAPEPTPAVQIAVARPD